MKIPQICFFLFFQSLVFSPFVSSYSQKEDAGNAPGFRVMFYNVENLFDTYDDSLKRDEEFLPDGERSWNNRKFYDKINKIYKVIMSVGEWNPPAIIGLSEVENRFVLEKLIHETPLKNFNYRIIHHESPDIRGIDVAILYRENFFDPFYDEAIKVQFEDDTTYKTRDILYVKGLVDGKEMVHIFVNHWPSRYGGYMPTIERRNHAANILKGKTDSLFSINPSTSILIMGDFNDSPTDESFTKVLQTQKPHDEISGNVLYNLMLANIDDWRYGTLKYRESWDIFDQLVVSGNLLQASSGLQVADKNAHIFHGSFILEEDKTYLGMKPFRTFTGFKYNGGFSDHLPVYLDLILQTP